MISYCTEDRHGYSIKFSPYNSDCLIVATSRDFGFAGEGSLFILNIDNEGSIAKEYLKLHWSDGLFDVVWSESNIAIIVSCSGDGTLQLWNLQAPNVKPIIYSEHKTEIYSVDWSKCRQENKFLSASWDNTIKLWDPNRLNSLHTFFKHSNIVYTALFSPHISNCFASASADGTLNIWNCLDAVNPISVQAHNAEILCCDWCKFDHNLIATGASDGLIRGWDIRQITQPVFQWKASLCPIKRIQFSPHCLNVLASVGYDFNTKIWDLNQNCKALEIFSHHSEFVYGLDWNIHRKGQIADCAWDSFVKVFTLNCLSNI
ncbi:peroxisomal targeting signal 2 receptor [Cylas formicarius]|uniref:peroxisomal targeting signal 2 receptor n=1 Tax=Cylas formicarius TaxID=197179 RepID=UPI00295833D4|nr:peroxisomal targeting signal 2 receptor [Cylas formicarius]